MFEDFLKLSDSKGIVDLTPESIARRTNVPLDIVRRGIATLEQPDPRSRTPDQDGKRLVRLDAHRDWGWQIVNFIKYRESATTEMLRMAEADRKREYRKRFHKSPSKPSPPKTEAEKEGEAEQSGTFDTLSRTRPGQNLFSLPSDLQSFPDYAAAWGEWEEYCEQKGIKLTSVNRHREWERSKRQGIPAAIKAIEASIDRGSKNGQIYWDHELYSPKPNGNGHSAPPPSKPPKPEPTNWKAKVTKLYPKARIPVSFYDLAPDVQKEVLAK